MIATSATIASSLALRIRQLAPRLHRLGPRPFFEFCCEIVGGADPMTRLERFAALDGLNDFIRANGGHDLPPPPLRLVKITEPM